MKRPDSHQFDLEVERGGEVVHRSSHEVRGYDGTVGSRDETEDGTL